MLWRTKSEMFTVVRDLHCVSVLCSWLHSVSLWRTWWIV